MITSNFIPDGSTPRIDDEDVFEGVSEKDVFEEHVFEEHLEIGLKVVIALEASLGRSRDALLAMSLESIESETTQQVGLVGELRWLEQRLAPPNRRGRWREKTAPASSSCEAASCEAAMLQQFRESGNRIKAATRLQAALLARARHKLHVLRTMLAGPTTTYRPIVGKAASHPREIGANRAGESDVCRA